MQRTSSQLSSARQRRTLRPTRPSTNPRYDKAAGQISTSRDGGCLLPAGLYTASNLVVYRWECHVHPEGKPYFYEKSRRIVTDSNLFNPEILVDIEEAAKLLASEVEAFRKEHETEWPEDSEAFLELKGDNFCDYYLVSVQYHTVFWLCEGGESLGLLQDPSPTAIRMNLEEQFWIHVAFFPMHTVLPEEDEAQLRGVLIFTCADQMTAPGSTSHLTSEESRQYLYLLDSTKLPTTQGSRTWLVARLMTTITRNRNHNYYGREGARLDRYQRSLRIVERPLTLLNRLLDGPFSRYVLFNAHVEYQRTIQLTAVDDVVLPHAWKALMTTCQRDWCTTMATALVLVLASTSLIGNGSEERVSSRSATISAALSLSSFAFALYQYQTHRGLESTHAYDAAAYLQRTQHQTSGYTPLAIRLSFSYVLLVWAIIAFTLALMLNIQRLEGFG